MMAGGNGDGTVRVLPRPLQSSDGHLVSNDLISRTVSERSEIRSAPYYVSSFTRPLAHCCRVQELVVTTEQDRVGNTWHAA